MPGTGPAEPSPPAVQSTEILAHALVHVLGPVDGLVVTLDVETSDAETHHDSKDDEGTDDGGGLTGGVR